MYICTCNLVPFNRGQMTEHLDGSYPNLKTSNKIARDNGQTNAHAYDMLSFGNYHIKAWAVVHYLATAFEGLEIDNSNGFAYAFSYSICSIYQYKKKNVW